MKHLALLLVLVVAALIFSLKIHGVWVREPVGKSPTPPRTAAGAPEKNFVRRVAEPLATYEPIVSSNLFNRERKEKITPPPVAAPLESVVTAPEIKEVRVAGQEIVLFGTMTRGDFKSALINNPLKSTEDKRVNRWVKIGDSIANLQVDAILRDRIILREGNSRYIVLMRDPAKPKVAAARPAATMANRSSPTVIPTDAAPVAAKMDEKPVTETGQATNTDKQGGDEYVIISTPFGKQRVRKSKP